LYQDVVDAIVVDEQDAALAPRIEALSMAALVAPTIMRDEADRVALALRVLDYAATMRRP
jgi:LPPG:FO 2-phospho-L-lactate transferase